MQIQRKKHEYDASQKPLGRLATQVATLLMGKRKVGYRPNVDSGDFVVVTRCREAVLTGKKAEQKVYYRFSGYPGGMKKVPLERQRAKDPTRIVYHAIYQMLPDNRLRKPRMRRLTLKP